MFEAAAALEGEFRFVIERRSERVIRHVGFPIDFAFVVSLGLSVVAPFGYSIQDDAQRQLVDVGAPAFGTYKYFHFSEELFGTQDLARIHLTYVRFPERVNGRITPRDGGVVCRRIDFR